MLEGGQGGLCLGGLVLTEGAFFRGGTTEGLVRAPQYEGVPSFEVPSFGGALGGILVFCHIFSPPPSPFPTPLFRSASFAAPRAARRAAGRPSATARRSRRGSRCAGWSSWARRRRWRARRWAGVGDNGGGGLLGGSLSLGAPPVAVMSGAAVHAYARRGLQYSRTRTRGLSFPLTGACWGT